MTHGSFEKLSLYLITSQRDLLVSDKLRKILEEQSARYHLDESRTPVTYGIFNMWVMEGRSNILFSFKYSLFI